MDRGLYVAASGEVAQSKRLDALSNNLANINVPGFKKDIQVFEVYLDKLSAQSVEPGTVPRLPDKAFVHISEVVTDFTQGMLRKTDVPTDVALLGDGFFVVKTENGDRYTRKGDFMVDAEGTLLTKDGYPVGAKVGVIKLTGSDFHIDETGRVTDGSGKEVGQLEVVDFEKPYKLSKAGNGLYVAEEGATPIEPTDARVVHGHIELANTSAVQEMITMITALRSYESQMKMIQTFDSVTEQAISLGNR
jgi:flagellar basal-body rod protein FlgG